MNTPLLHLAGNWKLYASDALGNLVTVLEPDPLATPVLTSPPATPPAYPVTTAPTGMFVTPPLPIPICAVPGEQLKDLNECSERPV